MSSPGLSVLERPQDLDSEKRCKRKHTSSHGHQKAADCKVEKQDFSLCFAVIEDQAQLNGEDRKVKKCPAIKSLECSVDGSAFEGPSSKKFKGYVTRCHDFVSTIIKLQHSGRHQSRPQVASSSHNPNVSMVIPFRRDEPTKAKKCPLMAHYGLTPSVEDSRCEGPPKKFRRDDTDKMPILIPLWQPKTI